MEGFWNRRNVYTKLKSLVFKCIYMSALFSGQEARCLTDSDVARLERDQNKRLRALNKKAFMAEAGKWQAFTTNNSTPTHSTSNILATT